MKPAATAELKLNIGCGTSGIDGWVNIDNSPTILLSRLPLGQKIFRTPPWPPNTRRMDVRKGMPFADNSVQAIYSSHTFEHFTYEESLQISKECRRVLANGGVLRIVVPDLAIAVREYLADRENPKASHRFIGRLLLISGVRDILHPGAHHRQMFDGNSLVHMLKEAGFVSPEVSSFGKSRISEIDKIELESRRAESLYVECVK
ncbi:MAG: methyltransferase domain-containing protein [Terriglobales bacterium]